MSTDELVTRMRAGDADALAKRLRDIARATTVERRRLDLVDVVT